MKIIFIFILKNFKTFKIIYFIFYCLLFSLLVLCNLIGAIWVLKLRGLSYFTFVSMSPGIMINYFKYKPFEGLCWFWRGLAHPLSNCAYVYSLLIICLMVKKVLLRVIVFLHFVPNKSNPCGEHPHLEVTNIPKCCAPRSVR